MKTNAILLNEGQSTQDIIIQVADRKAIANVLISSADFPDNSDISLELLSPLSLILGNEVILSFTGVEINAVDFDGNSITKFEGSVEICLSVPKNIKKDACLAYLNI